MTEEKIVAVIGENMLFCPRCGLVGYETARATWQYKNMPSKPRVPMYACCGCSKTFRDVKKYCMLRNPPTKNKAFLKNQFTNLQHAILSS